MIQLSHALGVNNEFIDFTSMEVPVHRGVIEPLNLLKRSAKNAGFHLGICSGFRSFEQQLLIWNEKAVGKRPLLNELGEPLDVNVLSPNEIVASILLWSALPGVSRHHWGCDFDVVDAGVVAQSYRPQLTQEECQRGGKFYDFHCWLSGHLTAKNSEFFRPYTERYEFGVAPEPWHLSYRPLAREFSQVLSIDSLRRKLKTSEIAYKTIVLEQLEHIYHHYVERYFEF